jgi:hypothetical protein
MSQIKLLKKLTTDEITFHEFLEQSEDPSIDKYKLTKEEFLKDSRISDSTKKHELMHARVYENEGMNVEFYFFDEENIEAATTATKESLTEWIKGKTNADYLGLLKRVVSAPDNMGYTDKRLLEILNSLNASKNLEETG